MKSIKGNKTIEIKNEEYLELRKSFEKVIIDLGTGDGRFIYKQAQNNPQNLYIGIDPAFTQMEIYSKKANRKRLKNTLFIIGSIEKLPTELKEQADHVYINLPWGTLLETVVKASEKTVTDISKLLTKEGHLEITFGYTPELEPSESERLDLPIIDNDFIEIRLIPQFQNGGFELIEVDTINKGILNTLDTTWAKKLSFGADRPIFKLIFKKH